MSHSWSRDAAGRWLLHSGIQEPCGGFARYYDAEKHKNRPVSTEITGYAASALVYCFRLTGDEEYLDCARRTAEFLVRAWDESVQAFPFEWPSPSPQSEHLTYFFDSGIVIRGLIAVWRETGDAHLLEIASAAAHAMIHDFRSDACDYNPILALPGKTPLPRSRKWSRAPGCYQLKSAMAWWDLAEITGESGLRDRYLETVDYALANHGCFLRESSGPYDAMDRLHAYAYFLEGLLPMIERADCRRAYADGVESMRSILSDVEPVLIRSDVLAQLLRIGIYCRLEGGETDRLAAFQAISDDSGINGGFWFGRRDGQISPQVNPVSTAFALQALQMEADPTSPCLRMLI